jgi:hypothetical protein
MTKDRFNAQLSELKHYLEQQGLQTEIQPPIESSPIEQLLVHLGKDTHEQELVLQLFWLSDAQADSSPIKSLKAQEDEPRFLQFFILFPFVIVESSLSDLSKMLFRINSAFDMAQFGLYEQKMVYYRYVHICAHGQFEGQAIQAILLSIQFLIETLLPSIMDVALARKTLKEVQSEAKQLIQEMELDSSD